jgi:hypothetical protein
LRQIRDRHLCQRLQILLTGTSEALVSDTPDSSGYMAFCRLIRPRPLDACEIQLLAAPTRAGSDTPVPFQFDDGAIEEFLSQTGGQPLLVRHLIRRLRGFAKASKKGSLNTDDVAQAANQMRAAPPEEVSFWQADLRDALMKRPELIDPMCAYVRGASLGPSRFPPPSIERPLFIGGWLGLNRLRRWGIASQFHADFARPVLDHVRSPH